MSDDSDASGVDDPIGGLPGRSKAEIGASIVSAGVSSIPLVGGAAAELFELVLAPSLEKRRDEWLRRLGEAVDELRDRLEGFDPRNLEGNEKFVSAVLAASTIAVKTHETEKLVMLRNALVNAVLPGAPEQHEQMTFLRYVDELTPLHVRILAFVADPVQWFDDRGLERPRYMSAGVATILELGMPELAGRRELYDRVAFELQQRGLADVPLHAMMTNDGVWSQRATGLGQRFLHFITLEEPTL